MRRMQLSQHVRLVAMVCSMALAACSPERGVTAPVPDRPDLPTGFGSPGPTSYMGTDIMTVTGANGVTYTLHGAKSQIRTSTGKTVSLSAAQVATYASYFQDANNGAATADSVESGSGPGDFEPYRVGGSTSGASHEPRVRVRFGGSPAEPPRATPGSGSVSMLSTDPCYELSVQIYNETKNFNNARDDWTAALGALIDVAISAAMGTSMPPLLTTGAQVLTHDLNARAMMSASTRLNILATQFKLMGCWDTFWGFPGPGGDTAGPTSMGSSRLECKLETAWISINGGPWKPVDVYVCEYVLYNQ